MATQTELQQIVRALNGVRTAGQARAAVGAAATALHNAYPVTAKLTAERERASRKELDIANQNLQAWFRKLEPMSASASVQREWPKNRQLIHAAYQAIAGVEGAAHHEPQTSNLQILLTSLAEAPQVFGKAVGAVAKEVGATAGSAVGGIFAGLGISGTLTVLVVLLVALVVLKKGSPLALLGKVLG